MIIGFRVKNPFARSTPAVEAADTTTEPTDGAAASASRRPKRLVALVAGVSALAVLGAGAAVASQAHKTITLDIDGETLEVSTWSGSVENLLEEQDITIGSRDLVAPSPGTALASGTDVVVRYARQVTVSDGEETSQMWTTAVDAEEILSLLSARGDDVHLVASRSAERAEIGIRLPLDEQVNVLVDDETLEVPLGTAKVDEALAAVDVELNKRDRVSVERLDADGDRVDADEEGAVTVKVARVEVKNEEKTKKVKHESKTTEDSSRFNDLPTIAQTKGKNGERTITHKVTYVDGKEESRDKVSNKVTTKPVTEVLVKGTKERPAPKPEPKPAPAPKSSNSSKSSSSPSSSSSKSAPKNQGSAPSSGVWSQLASCESGGNPSIVSSNGLYHGLYQFSVGTWHAMGGSGVPSQASAAEQLKRAKKLQAASGWGQWPACSSKLGLR